jgi:drug/metabolite transporter (DMT)-like permease
MRTPFISVMLFLIASALGALGQFLYKSGAERTSTSWLSYVWNWRLLSGVVCYIAVMVLFIAAFKKGGALSVLYPVYATTFIWAALIGMLVYGEPIKLLNILGMVMLIGGMYLMGR